MGSVRKGRLGKVLCLCFTYCVVWAASAQDVPAVILNKCCPDGEVYDFESGDCVGVNVKLKSEVKYGSDNNNGSNSIVVVNSDQLYFSSDLESYSYVGIPRRLVVDLSENRSDESVGSEFQFSLVPHFPTTACKEGNFIVQISLQESAQPNNNNNTESSSTVVTSDTIDFTSEGHLRIGTEYYSTPEYCLLGLKDQVLSIRVCNATCTGATPCIRKCCPLDQIWNVAKGKRQGCVPAGQHFWTPTLYKQPKVKATEEELNVTHIHYKVVHPRQFCRRDLGQIAIAIEERDDKGRYYWKFRINTKGQVFRRISRYTWKDKDGFPESYCLDGMINSVHLPANETQMEYSGISYDQVLFECLPPDDIDTSRPQSILYGCLMVFASIFLFLTILVHVVLWDKQPNRTWTLTLISYDASLFCLYGILVTMHITQFYVRQGPGSEISPLCYYVGVGVNFFLVSTFCWMSAVNYDIFRTFKVLKPSTGRGKGLRRYSVYALFAWTVPITTVTVALVLDKYYKDDFDSDIIVPEYGRTRCNLDPEYAQLVYSYGPAGVLLAFNLICFGITVYTMYSVQRSTKFATSSSSKNSKQKQSLKLFAKLLFVMGFPWIFEIISWWADRENVNGNAWYWVIFDAINIFQAIAIFYTFVCKPDVIHNLEQKYPSFKKFLDWIMFEPESAEKMIASHPKLKRFIKPLTRRKKGTNSGTRSGQTTETSVASSIAAESVRRSREASVVVKMEKTPSIKEEPEPEMD